MTSPVALPAAARQGVALAVGGSVVGTSLAALVTLGAALGGGGGVDGTVLLLTVIGLIVVLGAVVRASVGTVLPAVVSVVALGADPVDVADEVGRSLRAPAGRGARLGSLAAAPPTVVAAVLTGSTGRPSVAVLVLVVGGGGALLAGLGCTGLMTVWSRVAVRRRAEQWPGVVARRAGEAPARAAERRARTARRLATLAVLVLLVLPAVALVALVDPVLAVVGSLPPDDAARVLDAEDVRELRAFTPPVRVLVLHAAVSLGAVACLVLWTRPLVRRVGEIVASACRDRRVVLLRLAAASMAERLAASTATVASGALVVGVVGTQQGALDVARAAGAPLTASTAAQWLQLVAGAGPVAVVALVGAAAAARVRSGGEVDEARVLLGAGATPVQRTLVVTVGVGLQVLVAVVPALLATGAASAVTLVVARASGLSLAVVTPDGRPALVAVALAVAVHVLATARRRRDPFVDRRAGTRSVV